MGKYIKIAISFILLVIGAMIYICFRQKSAIMFPFLDSIGLGSFVDPLRELTSGIHPPDVVIYNLPDCLWATAYVLVMSSIWGLDMRNGMILLTILPMVAIMFEFLQLLTIVPGTFDILDIVSYLLPLAVVWLLYLGKKTLNYDTTRLRKSLASIFVAYLFAIIAGGSAEEGDMTTYILLVSIALAVGSAIQLFKDRRDMLRSLKKGKNHNKK